MKKTAVQLAMDEINRTTDLAECADEVFAKAIKSQFGSTSNRVDHDHSEYDELTKAAYNLKIACDQEMYEAWDNYRKARKEQRDNQNV